MAKTKTETPAEKKPKEKRKTISSLVLAYLDKKPGAETKEIYDHIVANGFPDTKFNKSHLAWYKYQVRQGNLALPSGKALPPSTRKKVEKKTAKKGKKAKKNTDQVADDKATE